MEGASTKSWILGAASAEAVNRLWERYQRLAMSKVDGGRAMSFSELRLSSLGVPRDVAERTAAVTPSVITDPTLLGFIEDHLKDENGRSLQRIITDDISSRVLIEVHDAFPDAAQLTKEAMSLLEDLLPWQAALLRKMVSWIVPIYHEKYNRPFRRGFSHMEFLGAVFTTFLERKTQASELRPIVLAVDLVHELGHQVLMLYQLADKIIESPLDAPVYSSVRKTNRPAIMALHACVAAAYMMEACEAAAMSTRMPAIAKEFAMNSLIELRNHQRLGLESLMRVSRFTPIGQLIVKDLERQIREPKAEDNVRESNNLSYFGLGPVTK